MRDRVRGQMNNISNYTSLACFKADPLTKTYLVCDLHVTIRGSDFVYLFLHNIHFQWCKTLDFK